MKKRTAAQPRVRDAFWDRYIQLMTDQVIPHQWDILNGLNADTYCETVRNFKIAANLEQGEHYGFVFQDSDLYKWLEAVGNALKIQPNTELEAKADEIISYIMQAQEDDGYLNTYFQIKHPQQKWSNVLECHELYCAGHLIEAAVSYYQATGKERILTVARKFADHIDTVFGPGPNQLHGYPGHQEIEIALIRLYRLTNCSRYLSLARYFIDTRGTNDFFEREFERRGRFCHWTQAETEEPNRRYNQFPYQEYNQFHLPVRQQSEAVGHAVRALYMYTAMAALAGLDRDESLADACRRLWEDIVTTKLYITGGVGSTNAGEAFTRGYDLPNDTCYCETCAAIGLYLFAAQMLKREHKAAYADMMEKVLYNAILSGVSLDGKKFLYVNPLEAIPSVNEANPERNHVKAVRQDWYECACCPPNIARTITDLPRHICEADGHSVYIHQYIGCSHEASVADGLFAFVMESGFPWHGNVRLRVTHKTPCRAALRLRLPQWCREYTVRLNQSMLDVRPDANGYLVIDRVWKPQDCVQIDFRMEPGLVCANPKVQYDIHKVALTRGPLVFCVEETDNDKYLKSYSIKHDTQYCVSEEGDMIPYLSLRCDALQTHSDTGGALYGVYRHSVTQTSLKAIPYFLWNNRKPGEMLVWMQVE